MENEIRRIALDEIESNQEQCAIEGTSNDRKQYTIGFNDGVLYMTKRVLESIENQSIENQSIENQSIENQSIYDHLKAISDFCEDSKGCKECPLHYDNPLNCSLENNVPCCWNLEEIKKNINLIESGVSE